MLLAVATARGDVPQAEEGEDVDLTTPPDWLTVAKLVAILVLNLLLVNVLGWAITGALLFAGCAWALGSRTLLRDVARRRGPGGRRAGTSSTSGSGCRSRRASSTGSCEAAVDTLNLLLDGFASAFTLQNLMYAAIGVLLGTFVGVLPGIGPAMALALLLPVTYGLDATQALIMFAGIYYGGMYGGSTTSILLNTPGESASVMTAIEGNKMAKKGRAAQALATAAIGSFIAGTIGTLLVAFFTPSIATWAVEIGAPTYFAIMLLAMVLVSSVLGASKLRGFIGLAIGLTIGLVGLDASTAQARLTGGWLELADGVDIVVVAVGVFAIGEALWTAAHLRRKPIDVIPVGRPFMGRSDWCEVVGTVAARHRAGLPVRRPARRWCGDADVPVLHHRAQAGRAPRHRQRVRRGRHRGCGRTGGRQQRERRRHVRAAARPRPARHRDGVDPARGDAEVRHRARADPDDRPARPDLDAARQPPDRQHAAAGDQPAARAGLGQAAADPAAAALRRHPVLRVPGRLQRRPELLRPRPAAVSAASASRSAGSASRCCR